MSFKQFIKIFKTPAKGTLLANPNIESTVLFWLSAVHLEKQIQIYIQYLQVILSNGNRCIFTKHSYFKVCERLQKATIVSPLTNFVSSKMFCIRLFWHFCFYRKYGSWKIQFHFTSRSLCLCLCCSLILSQ